MKQLWLISLLSISLATNAQITLEQAYPTKAYLTPFTNDGVVKYIGFDTANNNAGIYNSDHSLYKNVVINLPKTSKYNLNGVYALSTNIFDNDNGYEFLFHYTDMSAQPFKYVMRVYDEDGTIIKEFVHGWIFKLALVNNDWKAVIDYYNLGGGGLQWSEVYSLPGKAPAPPQTNVTSNTGSDIYSGIYPNPVHSTARIAYQLPGGTHQGSIQVYNTAGQLVQQYQVTDQFNDIEIARGTLPVGAYFYEISTGNGATSKKQFVIQ